MRVQSYRFFMIRPHKMYTFVQWSRENATEVRCHDLYSGFACNDGMSNVFFSVTDGVFHRVSLCQIACNSGGEGTPGPMQVLLSIFFSSYI